MTLSNGPRLVMDSTRLTQQGSWSGYINLLDEEIKIDSKNFYGTRDRSWGIRPVGAPDSQPTIPLEIPQFYWLWCPANFDSFSTHMFFVDDDKGKLLTGHSVKQGEDYSATSLLENLKKNVHYVSNTRRVSKAEFFSDTSEGKEIKISIEPKYNVFMCGLGYMHPEWGHGHFKGEEASSYDTYKLEEDLHDPPFLHIQAFCNISCDTGGSQFSGVGVLEQLFLGPHEPSGFKDLLDRTQ